MKSTQLLDFHNKKQKSLFQNYAAVLHAMNDLVFVLDTDRVFINIFQPKSVHLYIPPEAFLQKSISDVAFPPDTKAAIEKKINQIELTGQTQNIDYSLEIPGGLFHYNANISGIYDTSGQLEGFVMVVRDITAWVQQQLRINTITDKYNLAVKSARFGLWEINYSNDELTWNEEIEALFECKIQSSQHLRELFKNALPESEYEAVINCLYLSELKIDNFHAEYCLHIAGNLKYVEAFATFTNNTATGKPERVMCVVLDITNKKKAEIALIENEEKYRSLVEASNDIIFIMDENGKYLFANEIACKKINSTFEKVVGNTVYDFFDKEPSEQFLTKIKQVLNTRQPITFEAPVLTAGQYLWLRHTLQPIYDSAANVYSVMACLVDLTDLKNYSEKLLEQNHELKKIAQLQSHIVRAPLTNIQGLISLLDEKTFTDENKLYIKLLKESAQQLDNVIKEVVQRAIEVKQ
jgi:PAS domain S-box-containing protein